MRTVVALHQELGKLIATMRGWEVNRAKPVSQELARIQAFQVGCLRGTCLFPLRLWCDIT